MPGGGPCAIGIGGDLNPSSLGLKGIGAGRRKHPRPEGCASSSESEKRKKKAAGVHGLQQIVTKS